jgi:hypothetical protein
MAKTSMERSKVLKRKDKKKEAQMQQKLTTGNNVIKTYPRPYLKKQCVTGRIATC